MFLHGIDHGIDGLLHTLGLGSLANLTAEGDIVLSCDHEETCYHKAFGLGALRYIFGGLETLVRIP